MKETFCLYSDVFIRIDQTDTIRKQYYDNEVVFGCPANWIDYARCHVDGIADKYEAICGHVRKNDPRLSTICDDGIPLNAFRSLWNEEGPNYIYDCLTPTICFYSIDVKETLKEKPYRISYNLQEFYSSLGLKKEECSILVILDVNRFLSDLRKSIPIELTKHNHINTERFDPNCVLLAENMHYDLNLKSEFFHVGSLKSIYHKQPKYSPQKEARLIIPGVFFTSDPVFNANAYKDNRLSVHVSCLKEYSHLINARDVDYLICDDYRKESDDFSLSFTNKD